MYCFLLNVHSNVHLDIIDKKWACRNSVTVLSCIVKKKKVGILYYKISSNPTHNFLKLEVPFYVKN